MALLRDYHAAIGEIIIKYSGTLERYAGDGVMVVFNDPVPVDNPALRAVQMALETRDAMGALTEKWRRLGHEVGFGIGIAHGYATLGTIGFEGGSTTPPLGRYPMSPLVFATKLSRVKSDQSARFDGGQGCRNGRAGGRVHAQGDWAVRWRRTMRLAVVKNLR